MVFDDRPVTINFGTAAALADAGIRKAVEREGLLRIIEIEGFDRQPCGGTHVARASQVGPVLVRHCERQKQNWRVEFVCGFRALRAARGDLCTLGEAARELSCGLPEVPAMVRKALEERQASFRARQRMLEQLAAHEAAALLAGEYTPGGPATPRVLVRVWDDVEPAYLRLLAAKLAAMPGVRALLATRAGGHIVLAQSPGMPGDLATALRETVAPVGGKGGGSKDFAQGSVPDPASLETVLAQARDRLRT